MKFYNRAFIIVASFFLLTIFCLAALPALAQPNEFPFGAGGSVVGTIPVTEGDDVNPSWGLRGFARYTLLKYVAVEGGAGYFNYVDRQKKYDQLDVEGYAIPVDLRGLFLPWPASDISPYLFVGIGCTFFDADNRGTHLSPFREHGDLRGTYMHIPVGIGAALRLSWNWRVELQAGNNLGLSDALNPNLDGTNDHLWVGTAGLFYRFGTGPHSEGPDDREVEFDFEEALQPPESVGPDADGDGLSDSEETEIYLTDPLKADSDGDGLNDQLEVKRYRTDPQRTDTDGDALTDKDEVMNYRTNPLRVDSDGDGLTDGAEVLTHKTNPNNPDTDGDGVSDGDEVMKYRSDPLKAE